MILRLTLFTCVVALGHDKVDDSLAGKGEALALARSLDPPAASATLDGEFENADFWQKWGPLLRLAWDELGRAVNAPESSVGWDVEGKRDDLRLGLGDVVDASLARAALTARADPTAEAERAVLSLWSAAVPSAPVDLGVYRTRLLTVDGLRRIRFHLDRAASSGIPTRRPNGMNRHGVILDENVDGAVSLPALTGFVDSLVDEIVRPVGRALFPADAGKGDDADYFSFTIRYSAEEDVELREHRDASVFTLNVNLNLPGEGYGGSALYFVDPSEESRTFNVEFEPGIALLHRGSLKHAALPIEEGSRQNLVIWLFGKGGDVRILPYAENERLSVEERWERDLSSSPWSWWNQAYEARRV